MRRDALALGLVVERHHDAPAGVEEASRHGGAEAARPAGDERAAQPSGRPTLQRSVRSACDRVAHVRKRPARGHARRRRPRGPRGRAARQAATACRYLRLLLGDRTGALPANLCDDVEAASTIATVGAVGARQRAPAGHRRAAAPQLTLDALRAAVARARSTSRRPARRATALGGAHGGRPARARRDGPGPRPAPAARRGPRPRHADVGALPHGARGQALSTRPTATACSSTRCRSRRRSARSARRSPGIDRDVAVTGALLHDIGKLDAYAFAGDGDRDDRRRQAARRDPARLLPRPRHHRRAPRLRSRDGAGRPAHHPQPPRQPRARQPRGPVHARGDARALLRQPRRAARLVRPAREGAGAGRALVALRSRDRRRARSSPATLPRRSARPPERLVGYSPPSTRIAAAATTGSNCVPAFARSSASATPGSSASR